MAYKKFIENQGASALVAVFTAIYWFSIFILGSFLETFITSRLFFHVLIYLSFITPVFSIYGLALGVYQMMKFHRFFAPIFGIVGNLITFIAFPTISFVIFVLVDAQV